MADDEETVVKINLRDKVTKDFVVLGQVDDEDQVVFVLQYKQEPTGS